MVNSEVSFVSESQNRSISSLTRKTLALVLAGGQGSRLHELTEWRSKPAVYFGGKFRIIDFALSNCMNSGIRRIGVLTQYKAHSLIRHLVQAWSFSNSELGEFLEILPASQRVGGEWYKGTADAVYQNLDIIRTHRPDNVLILAGDHIYKMDYGPMIAFHEDSKADMTVSCIEVPVDEAANTFGVIEVNQEGRIIGFEEKPSTPRPLPGQPGICLASMGNYVVKTNFLYNQLIEDADDQTSSHDFGKDLIPRLIKDSFVIAYPFRDTKTQGRAYWQDVGTLDAFWKANIDLISVVPELDLYGEDWPLLTYQIHAPPARFVFNTHDRQGVATDSMVSGGCIISGASVDKSVLFSKVRVHSWASVEHSVVFPKVTIGRHARIKNAIIDRGCHIPVNTVIGENHDADRERGFRVSQNGIVLVTPSMLGQDTHQLR